MRKRAALLVLAALSNLVLALFDFLGVQMSPSRCAAWTPSHSGRSGFSSVPC